MAHNAPKLIEKYNNFKEALSSGINFVRKFFQHADHF